MTTTTAKPTLRNIKLAVPIDRALAHYGITLKAQSARLVGPCPIHQGSNPQAFVVSADRHAWYCFGDCKRGGSVLELVMALENCSLPEAAAVLAQRYALPS